MQSQHRQGSRDGDKLSSNLRWGVTHGLTFSCFLVAIVLVASRFSAEVVIRGHTVPTLRIVLGYLIGGILAGGILGLLRQRASSRIAYVLIGSVAGILAYLSIAVGAFGRIGLDVGIVLLGAGMGGLVGYFLYP